MKSKNIFFLIFVISVWWINFGLHAMQPQDQGDDSFTQRTVASVSKRNVLTAGAGAYDDEENVKETSAIIPTLKNQAGSDDNSLELPHPIWNPSRVGKNEKIARVLDNTCGKKLGNAARFILHYGSKVEEYVVRPPAHFIRDRIFFPSRNFAQKRWNWLKKLWSGTQD